MKFCYVKLVRMKLSVLCVEPVDEELRLFSSMEKAETWLVNNDFVYGQRSFFNYPSDDKEWFHKDDMPLEYIDVNLIEMNMDDLSESKFKNLKGIHREWLPQFLKDMEEDVSPEDRGVRLL